MENKKKCKISRFDRKEEKPLKLSTLSRTGCLNS